MEVQANIYKKFVFVVWDVGANDHQFRNATWEICECLRYCMYLEVSFCIVCYNMHAEMP